MSQRDPSTFPSSALSNLGRRLLTAALFLVICTLIIDALVGDQGLVATRRAREQDRQLTAELEHLRTRNAHMREDIRHLREDRSTIDEIARRDLGLMSPGEMIFIIRDIHQPDAHLPVVSVK